MFREGVWVFGGLLDVGGRGGEDGSEGEMKWLIPR